MSNIVRINKRELEKFKAEEARARMELVRRVESGEITAEQANQEAAFIKEPQKWRTINLDEFLISMAPRTPAKKKNGRRR